MIEEVTEKGRKEGERMLVSIPRLIYWLAVTLMLVGGFSLFMYGLTCGPLWFTDLDTHRIDVNALRMVAVGASLMLGAVVGCVVGLTIGPAFENNARHEKAEN